MSDWVKTLFDKMEKQDEKLESISLTLERNTVTLEEHVKRTNLLEQEMKPVKSHVNFVNGLAKLISMLLAIAMLAKTLGLFH